MAYYIGIDGGGTKTLLRMIDDNDTVVLEQTGGGSNPYTSSPQQAEQTVSTLVTAAKQAAGEQPIKAVCMGAAGADTPEDFVFFEQLLERLLPDSGVRVVNDGYASLYATLPSGEEGVVITAGTGSICWGRSRRGACCRVGGWGNLFSDEGSGYAIVIDAMREVCLAIDGRGTAGTELYRRFLAATGTKTGEELVGYLHAHPAQKDIAAYFPVVSGAAADGDAAALSVLDRGAKALCAMCMGAAARLQLSGRFAVGYNGGVLTRCDTMRRLFEQNMQKAAPDCHLIEGRREVVWGNLMIAKTVNET